MIFSLSLLILSIYITLIIKCVISDGNVIGGKHERDDEIVLSRRKRYLIFPEGSSLQLGQYYEIFLYVF